MNFTDLCILLKSVLDTGLTEQSITATVRQNRQPRHQGRDEDANIMFFHVGTVNVGWPGKTEVWDADNEVFVQTQTQRKESRFQISALAPVSPATPTGLTPEDYLNVSEAILQSDTAITTFAASGVGVQHVTGNPSGWFENDQGQNENNPTFDIILSWQKTMTANIPKIDETTYTVEGV